MIKGFHEVTNSPVEQGKHERIAYRFRTTPWGTGPSAVENSLWDVMEPEWQDVSSTLLAGSPSVNGDTIVTAQVYGLTPGKRYRLEINFVCVDGNTYECYVIINAVK